MNYEIHSTTPDVLQEYGSMKTYEDARDLMLYVMRGLTKHHNELRIDIRPQFDSAILTVFTHPEDISKLIGVGGQTARCLHSLARAMSARLQKRISMTLVDHSVRANKRPDDMRPDPNWAKEQFIAGLQRTLDDVLKFPAQIFVEPPEGKVIPINILLNSNEPDRIFLNSEDGKMIGLAPAIVFLFQAIAKAQGAIVHIGISKP